MTSRSALPGQNGNRKSDTAVSRLTLRRAIPRAKNTHSLVRSATETRDIDPLLPSAAIS